MCLSSKAGEDTRIGSHEASGDTAQQVGAGAGVGGCFHLSAPLHWTTWGFPAAWPREAALNVAEGCSNGTSQHASP